jgi:hypothetical protein
MAAEELERQSGAERQPEHVRALEAERLDEPGEAVGVAGQAVLLGRVPGVAAPWRVPGDHRELVGELVELGAPVAAVAACAVEQQERRPFAAPLERDRVAFNLDGVGPAGH